MADEKSKEDIAREKYDQLKVLTSRAVDLTSTGDVNALGPILSKMEIVYAELKKVDPALDAVRQAARASSEEAALSVRIIAYADDTNIFAAETHLIRVEKEIDNKDILAARAAYQMIKKGSGLRQYLKRPHAGKSTMANDLEKRVKTLDEMLS